MVAGGTSIVMGEYWWWRGGTSIVMGEYWWWRGGDFHSDGGILVAGGGLP